MYQLGSSHLAAGRRDEGVSLLQEHLRLKKESLGAKHPDTLESMNEVGRAIPRRGFVGSGTVAV